MQAKLKEGWFVHVADPAVNLAAPGIYQWSIEEVGIYVGKAKVLRRRLRAYPNNVRRMLEGKPWHGNAARDYRRIHHALREAYETGKPVVLTVLEVCRSTDRLARERHWIEVRRREAQDGGPPILND